MKSLTHVQNIKDDPVVHLTGAVVNHELVNRMGISVTNVADDNSFAGEIVQFAIIEKAYSSITGQNVTELSYSIRAEVNSNFVFFPKISDAFARSLDASKAGGVQPGGDQRSFWQKHFGPSINGFRGAARTRTRGSGPRFTYSPTHIPKEPTSIEQAWKWIKEFYSQH